MTTDKWARATIAGENGAKNGMARPTGVGVSAKNNELPAGNVAPDTTGHQGLTNGDVAPSPGKIVIGMPVYVFNENRRVYRPDKNGRPSGPPVWLEHWVRMEIVGETSRSWLIGSHAFSSKFPKAGFPGNRLTSPCLSMAELSQKAWVHENRRKIAYAVEHCGSYADLRRIADALFVSGLWEEVE